MLAILQDADRPTVETICGLRRAGCDISAVCHRDSPAREALAGADVALPDFQITKRFDLGELRRLRRELVKGGYDILHAFGNRGLQNGVIALRGLGTRLVTYRGRVGNISFFDPFCWMRHLNPRVDRVICVSDAVRDFFLTMRPAFLRAPPRKFVRIYKGHDLAWYQGPPADLTAFGIPEHAFVVTCVANFRPHKGIEHLVEAMSHLPAEMPVHLLLVGKTDSPGLDRLIDGSPNAGRIHRIGYRRDAPALAAASDVSILPSTIPEGLPRSVIEAMAYGRPCIVTNLGGSTELVVDGVSGLHVPPGNAGAIARAIVRLFEKPELRERMGRAARQRIAERFDIEQTIDQTLHVYREILRESGAR